MKYSIIFFILMITIISCSSNESFIPLSQQTIITDISAIYDPKNEIKTWIPEKQQSKKALNKIFMFLKNNNNSEVNNIIINRNKFGVQFIGIIRNNKKYIYCNFFPYDNKDYLKIWKKIRILIFDGGFWYWNIEYNIEDDKCESLWINGYA